MKWINNKFKYFGLTGIGIACIAIMRKLANEPYLYGLFGCVAIFCFVKAGVILQYENDNKEEYEGFDIEVPK